MDGATCLEVTSSASSENPARWYFNAMVLGSIASFIAGNRKGVAPRRTTTRCGPKESNVAAEEGTKHSSSDDDWTKQDGSALSGGVLGGLSGLYLFVWWSFWIVSRDWDEALARRDNRAGKTNMMDQPGMK